MRDQLHPDYRAAEESSGIVCPEQRLFLSVIIAAIVEAVGQGTASHPAGRQRIQAEARDWFYKGGEDFDAVCVLAGLEPDDVRPAALAYFAAHDRGEIAPRRRRAACKSAKRPVRHGISQDVIASHAGLSQQTVSRVLTGITSPQAASAQRVRAAVIALTGEDPFAEAA